MTTADSRGVTMDLRREAVLSLKRSIIECLKQTNKIDNECDIEGLAAKLEQKIYQSSIGRKDYERKILSKLCSVREADKLKASAASIAGDELRNGMTTKPSIHHNLGQQNIGNYLPDQKPNMIAPQYQHPRNLVVHTNLNLSDEQLCQQPMTAMQLRNVGLQTTSNLLGQQFSQQPMTTMQPRNVAVQTTSNQSDQLFGQQPMTAMQPRKVVVQTTPSLLDEQFCQQIAPRDPAYSHQLSQQPMAEPLIIRHQRNIVPQRTTNSLDQRFGQQISIQRDAQDQLMRQSIVLNGTFATTNSVLSINRCQQPVESSHHKTNVNTQQMPYRSSSPYLQVISQEQRNHSPIYRIQRSGMPSTNLISQNSRLENNCSIQSQLPSTPAASAFSLSPDYETSNADWKRYMNEHQRARMLYVPELQKLYKERQYLLLKEQRTEMRQRLELSIKHIKTFISLLNASETQLRCRPIDELRQLLDNLARAYASGLSKSGTSQASHGQARVNGFQNTWGVSTMPVSSSSKFPPTVEETAPLNPHSSAGNSPLHVSAQAKEQMDRRPLLQSVSQGVVEHNTHSSTRQEPQFALPSSSIYQTLGIRQPVKLPEKEKDIVDPTAKPMNNVATRVSGRSRPRGQPAASTSHESWLSLAGLRTQGHPISAKLPPRSSVLNEKKRDASSLSDAGAVSQLTASVSPVNLPSAPVTPSSIPMEVGNFVKSSVPESSALNIEDTLIFLGMSECEDGPEVLDKSAGLGTPGLSACPVVSDFAVPENSQHSLSSKQPIDHSLNAIQSVSWETLFSAADDMRSAIGEMDALPAYAFLDDGYSVTLDDDLDKFLEEFPFSTDDVHKDKKIKRDFELVSRDVSTPVDHDSVKQSGWLYNLATPSNPIWRSKPEANQELLDEIRQINNKFIETVTEVVSDSEYKNDGIVVRCTYKPESIDEEVKRAFIYNGKPSIDLSIEFLVPFGYPNLPPKILDKLPVECVGLGSDMTERAKSEFDREIRGIDPLRIGEMAKLWYDCARMIFLIHVRCLPRLHNFTSKFGNCESALPDPSPTVCLPEPEYASKE